MKNKTLLVLTAFGCFSIFLIVFYTGVLNRFNTISANCELVGLGFLTARYQYSSTNKDIKVNINGIEIDKPDAILLINDFTISNQNHLIKIDLENEKAFATLKNKSYSGKCNVEKFKM